MKYGTQSLRVDYRDGARLTRTQDLTQRDRYVSLWVYGDGSGNLLSAAFAYEDGTSVSQSLATLNFTGWKKVTAAVPDGAATFQGLTLSGGGGALWLDQLVLANESGWDSTAPHRGPVAVRHQRNRPDHRRLSERPVR